MQVYSLLVLPQATKFLSLVVLSQNMYIVPLQWDTDQVESRASLPKKKKDGPQNHSNIQKFICLITSHTCNKAVKKMKLKCKAPENSSPTSFSFLCLAIIIQTIHASTAFGSVTEKLFKSVKWLKRQETAKRQEALESKSVFLIPIMSVPSEKQHCMSSLTWQFALQQKAACINRNNYCLFGHRGNMYLATSISK